MGGCLRVVCWFVYVWGRGDVVFVVFLLGFSLCVSFGVVLR